MQPLAANQPPLLQATPDRDRETNARQLNWARTMVVHLAACSRVDQRARLALGFGCQRLRIAPREPFFSRSPGYT